MFILWIIWALRNIVRYSLENWTPKRGFKKKKASLPVYKWTVSDDELEDRLNIHKKWLNNHYEKTGLHFLMPHKDGVRFAGIDLEDRKLNGLSFVSINCENANFRNAKLQNADFSYANLKKVNFQGAQLDGANLTGAYLHRANLQRANLRNANLSNSRLQNTDLRNSDFSNANVTSVKYNRGIRCKGIKISTSHGSPMFKRFVTDQEYIEEFRSSVWRVPIYLIWLIFADCGRSLSRWAGWSILVALFFGIQYYDIGQSGFDIKNLEWNLGTLMYYSVVTFTTLGFGDVVPKTQEAAQWVMAEVIIGYLMLGGLISIFATKLVRRS